MKKIIFLLAIFLTACSFSEAAPTQEPNAIMAAQAITTQTMTLIPSPTLDHAATIAVAQTQAEDERQNAYRAQQEAINAQQTSVAAGVELARITEAHEAGLIIVMQATQSAEAIALQATQQVQGWTATAALTSVPATQTQQAINNTQIPAQQRIMSTAQSMTIVAPTLVAAIIETQERAKYGWINYVVLALGSLLLFALMVYVILFINHSIKITEQKEAHEAEEVEPFIVPLDEPLVVTVKTDAPYPQANILTVPCTPDMLTEFADGIVNEYKQLAVKYWEGSQSKLWTRELYYPMRHFMQANQYAQSAGGKDGRLVLLAAGEAFLRGWLTTQSLPHRYKFDPNIVENPAETSLNREPHGQEKAVGEVKSTMGEPELHPL